MAIKLIAGLGNPGIAYEKTRHNAGAWLLELFAHQESATFKNEKKFHARVADFKHNNQACKLLIPNVYMNQSGQAIRAYAQFQKLAPEEILIVHDELDLPVGIAKFKSGGGHGGHNGLRDIIAHLSSKQFHRLRLGIGHPGHRQDVVDYVLKKPSVADKSGIMNAIEQALHSLPAAIEGNMQKAMLELHS